ncbi:uncharacterized protein sS8_3716 [Methylocaldum marinum]|uniref:Uncharacterized protein n=1 Tax=Methylocaldum marinum TaxID=1432792 RepID=A0A250KVE9_9GAMM|nr:hypothetical protein [Methylocaldum marinum]BBA35653.1 uncharacterized protein sS8_3716 [Methylocaldum marinum]
MLTSTEIARMSPTDRMGEAMRLSLPHVPAGARTVVESMLTPETLTIVTGTLAVWAGSHFFGVGEIVDLILLGAGFISLGFAVFEGSSEFYDFATGAIDARSEADLERAGRHFAQAATLLGISTIQALLLRRPTRTVVSRGRPQMQPRIYVGAPPPAGNQLRLSRTTRPLGGVGETDAYGMITISRNQSLTEQRVTLFHELVHRYFSPRTGPLRQIRAELNMSAYSRSALLRYLEEALAEGYGQLRVHGLAQALGAYRFPLNAGYMTISDLASEGILIGRITLGGALFKVSISIGPIPNHD